MIDMNKQYQTRNGHQVRILCTDGPDPYPVIGIVNKGCVRSWTPNGKTYSSCGDPMDLVEVSPYAEFKIDEPVMAEMEGQLRKRYFAGIDKNGNPLVWTFGSTRWSSEANPISVHSIRRPTEDEMK